MDTNGNNNGLIATDVLAPTRVIAGKYHLGKVLGEGGMGAVYEAEHPELGTKVAVKLLSESSVNNPNSLARFRREAKVMGQIHHENVVSVMDAGNDESGIPFLVMELLDGESLAGTLRRERVLSPGLSAWIISEVLAGLGAAHAKKIVHRDLKPGNVYIATQSDGSRRIKLLDFGISKLGDSSATLNVTAAGALVGTPNFMAPEQIRTDHDLDGRVDIYAAGIMLYRMVTGKLPYVGSNAEELYRKILEGSATPITQVRPELPAALEAVITKAMHPERESRYQSALEFQTDLQHAVPSESYGSLRQLSTSRPIELGPDPSLASASSHSDTVNLPDPYSTRTTKASGPAAMHHAAMQSSHAPSQISTEVRSKSWQWVALISIALVAIVGGVLAYTITHNESAKDTQPKGNSASQPIVTEDPKPDPDKGPIEVAPAYDGPPIRIGITRHKEPEAIRKELKPLVDYLSRSLERPVELSIMANYENFSGALAKGEIQMAAMSAAAYIRAQRTIPSLRLLATPTTKTGPTYGAYILSKASSGISTLADLKDKVFCYTSKSSSSGYLYPRAVFRQAGIDPETELKTRFTSDHMESLRALAKGGCDGAAVYDKAWLEASQNGLDPATFTVIKSTERVPWDAYVVTDTLEKDTAEALRKALISLKLGSPLAQEVLVGNNLPFAGFLAADDSLYDPVRSLEKFLILEQKED